MAITTYNEAIAFANSPQGKATPGLFLVIDELNYQVKRNPGKRGEARRREAVNAQIQQVNLAQQNPVQFAKNSLNRQITGFYQAYNAGRGGERFFGNPEEWKKQINNTVNFLIQNKTPAIEIQNEFTKAAQQYKAAIENDIRMQSQKNIFDRILDVADTLIVGGLTGGLGLSAVNAAALSSALAIANGANAEEAIRAGLGSIAASQVPDFLKNVNNLIPNDALYAGLVNAERQAVNALLTGQDPKQAALAGFAGGTTAGFLASDNAAIARASGEYIQALAAGRSPTDAMMSALSGFAQTEYEEAQKKILAEKQARDEGRTTIASDAAPTPTTAPTGAVAGGTAAPTTGATGGAAALPEVTVTGTAPSSTAGTNLSLLPSGQTRAPTTPSTLPTVTVTGTPDNVASANLSLQSTATTTPEKTPEKVKTPEERAADTTLLSLLQPRTIFGPGGARSDPTRTSSTVGSQALAQALRVGDLGAPIFGRKEEGRRAGWNVESLRYMGNSEG